MWSEDSCYVDKTWFDQGFSLLRLHVRRAWRRRPRNPWPEIFFASGSLLSGFGVLFLFQMLLTPLAALEELAAQLVSALVAFAAGQHFLRLSRGSARFGATAPTAGSRSGPARRPKAVPSPRSVAIDLPPSAEPQRDTRSCLQALRQAGVNLTIARALVSGGFRDAEALRRASDEALLAVRGVGPATIRKVRACFGTA